MIINNPIHNTMKNAQEIIETYAAEIMAYWNEKKGTNFNDFSFDQAWTTCSTYLSMMNSDLDEGIVVRFSDHSGTRGGYDISLPYSAIVNDIADENWFEQNDIDEDDKINYRHERFELCLENLDFYLR